MNNIIPEDIKHEIEQFHQARIEILRQMKFENLIVSRSFFLRSGEITNAGEAVYHLLDEIMWERDESLFDALRQKLKSRIPPNKIGYYAALMNDEYEEEFGRSLNRFTHQFLQEYCIDGRIAWRKLAEV